MRRVRIGIIGAGATTEWAVLPALSGPDAVAPPDTGSWWGRRAGGASDIRYQAPARPEVVALCDEDGERVRRVGESFRVRAVYTDWRLMLREVEMDALLCLVSPAQAPEIIASAGAAVRWLWIDGPPAPTSRETMQLAHRLEGRSLRVWCAHPLRQAAAHRAAWRLIERGTLGEVCALNLRWSTPLHLAPASSPSVISQNPTLPPAPFAPPATPPMTLLPPNATSANATSANAQELTKSVMPEGLPDAAASADTSDAASEIEASANRDAQARRMSTDASTHAAHSSGRSDAGSGSRARATQAEAPRAAPDAAMTDAPYLAASYAALDVLLAFGAPLRRGATTPAQSTLASAASASAASASGTSASGTSASGTSASGASASGASASGASASGASASGASASGVALGTVARVLASSHGGATSLWLQFASGASATALFAGAESWNVPFPRLEVCGTQGRSLVCEAGRRLWLHQPREASHFLEPPGLASYVSQANVLGLAEDLKAFLSAVAESNNAVAQPPRADGFDARAFDARENATEHAHSLNNAARVLSVLEAASASLRCNAPVAPTTEAGAHGGDQGVAHSPHGILGGTMSTIAAPEAADAPRPTATSEGLGRGAGRDSSRDQAKSDASRGAPPLTLPLPL